MRLRTLLWACVLVSIIPAFQATQAAELPDGFRLEPVVTGLTEPSSVAQTPDGRLLITERTTGNLRQVRHGELQALALCTVAVNSTGEAGLLGVAVHPSYSTNGWIYLYYTDLATSQNRVRRYTIQGDSCGGATTILSGLAAGPSFLRNGGGIGFGPDGKLYVATGDMEDAGSGQDSGVLEGKVLRLNDDGSIPGDNPSVGSPIYAIGVRDGRGLALQPAGQVYVGDRGDPVTHDEVHLAAPGGNLGWDAESGSGGSFDDPLAEWLPSIGLHGLAVYAADVFPDLDADGKDTDHDSYGPDHRPGVKQINDNTVGECVGSVNFGQPCSSALDCQPTRPGETAICWLIDEALENCPGGSPNGDDICGNTGVAGTDEPDESYLNNVFVASGNKIQRSVIVGAGLDQANVSKTFMDSTALPGCPTGWTGVMAGSDGFLYTLATNTGGASGGLYRIVHDAGEPGPREVSQEGSPFGIRVDKVPGLPNRVRVFWEDLRENSMQPQHNGDNSIAALREYTVWGGTLGSYYTHAPIVGLEATAGTEINPAYRRAQVQINENQSYYFLVSGRHDNLEGTLGRRSSGVERPGYTVTDLCDTIGYFSGPAGQYFDCGPDFTLKNEYGETVSLHEYRGHPIVLDMSARWCPPCQEEAKVIEQIHQDYKDRGVKVITILMDEQQSQTTDWHGRPVQAECRIWANRPAETCNTGTSLCVDTGGPCTTNADCPDPDHTFDCWLDPAQCPAQATTQCPGSGGRVAWPDYNVGFSLPTNIILDQGLGVAYQEAGWGGAIDIGMRGKLNVLAGLTDVCLH